jgi:GH15 family glucan-1,4-alpha-glucosidase
MSSASKIQDYAIIGDGRSAALVSRNGSIDWLCWPRFDSPSLFGALLDAELGGSWSIGPLLPAQTERRYLDGTNILETRFCVAGGVVIVTDFMPAVSEEEKRRLPLPEHELLRRVTCESGECEVRVRFAPRSDYGRRKLVFRDAGPFGLRAERAATLIALQSSVKLTPAGDDWLANVVLRTGDQVDFSLTYSLETPAVLPPLGELLSRKLDMTAAWWRRWAGHAQYSGPYQQQVIRSALVLKLLSHAPSGAIVAAPTTSLPERLGGDRNWDYRYCWLRDAAFTARALFGLGYHDEGEAFVSWLLHATRLTRPELRVVYDAYGNRPPRETELAHFAGYGESRPVRVGNAARDQLQLDVYGETVEAVTHSLENGQQLDRETQRMLRQFGKYVCRHWREADNGIWESRGARQHYTHSRLMCWMALDCLLEMHSRGQIARIPVEKLQKTRDAIRQEIEQAAWNQQLESYVQIVNGDTVDATALLLALHGFHDPDSWRMQRTLERVQARLAAGPGLLYRNEQARDIREGAFAMCGFWIAEFLARGGGTLQQAHDAFTHNLRYANELGLFAEEIDPDTGDALGNFPQAFTHIGLINAALSLAERENRDRAKLRQPRQLSPLGARV